MFPASSRYYRIETAKYENSEGRQFVYLQRRFLPFVSADAPVIAEHWVTEDERLDNITAHYLRDPEQFWRLCDANNAMQPEELTAEIGRRLRIALPQGS